MFRIDVPIHDFISGPRFVPRPLAINELQMSLHPTHPPRRPAVDMSQPKITPDEGVVQQDYHVTHGR
jgi:hypothetical protein